jgi:dTMP kinase
MLHLIVRKVGGPVPQGEYRSHLKKVFSPDIGVDPSPQVLNILKYACGLSLGLALISNENPNFEIASRVNFPFQYARLRFQTLKERDLFITFEGIEGCGKTTQVQRLEKFLEDHDIPVLFTLEPGGTRIGTNIRRILLDIENNNIAPLAELLLYEADRAQHVEEVIKPALDEGKWVVCDRFFDATVAYQGSARGQDMKLIQYLNDKVTQGIRPDLTFLLDCPVRQGVKRALMRNLSVKGH